MIGAIIGDIVGSRFEWNNHRDKDFELFTDECFFTDDSVMTVAIADALLWSNYDFSNLSNRAITSMREIGKHYPTCGYGGAFADWVFGYIDGPYNSWGNGAAMRVSPCAYFASSVDHVKELSKKVTEVTHNHPEGIKGAEAVAVATYMGLCKRSKDDIREEMRKYYNLDFTIDAIRPFYRFNESCQGTVPQAIVAFLESTSFEDAIRNAISVGGDSDTLAAITGGIAEAFYGVPVDLYIRATSYLDKRLMDVLNKLPGVMK